MIRSIAIAIVGTVAMSGCANVKLAAPTPVIDNVSALSNSGISKVAVAKFTLGPNVSASSDKSTTARGNPIAAESGSFAVYLHDTLIADLAAAGKYDASSTTSLNGEVLRNDLHAAGFSEADAELSVHFRIEKNGQIVFDKVVDQNATWKSSFVGAVAIPDAMNHFTDQFHLVLLKLYQDDGFKNALQP